MKQLLKTVIRNVKSVRGNSLAEFATTTALMATLAATAAPKLSEMSEGAKGEKSRNEIDKIVKMAGQFYQDVADLEGRGRFPNQKKFNVPIGDAAGNGGDSDGDDNNGVQYSFTSDTTNSGQHTRKILKDLGIADAFRIDADEDGTIGDDELATDLTLGWDRYSEDPQSEWQSVFGFGAKTAADMGISGKVKDAANHNAGTSSISNEWDNLFGDEVLGSTFQDGHYVYAVVAGGGTGADVYPPTIYVVDIESAVDFNNVLMP
jgi:hypothetical protein